MSGRELGLWQILLFSAAGLLVFLSGWELLVRTGVIDPFVLPAPSAVVDRMTQLAGAPDAVLWTDVEMSATRVFTGFVLSALVGIPLGLLMGMLCISITGLVLDILFRGVERLLLPWRREAR